MHFLDFEQPIAELDSKMEALRQVHDANTNVGVELGKLETKKKALVKKIFGAVTDWQVIQLARHPDRPYTQDYIDRIFDDFDELHGDRAFSDDAAIVGGIGNLDGRSVMVIGQQKGRVTKEKLKRNFGMPHPEGYRKAKRLMQLANHFNIPVVTLIDTAGAYPGVNAEARGQAEAIASNLLVMAELRVPVICVVIGEGCSGGALGIGVGDRLVMLEYSYYATISPEGCASILWKDAEKASHAASIMGITAQRLHALGIVDEIIPEPLGGAHRNYDEMAKNLKQVIKRSLEPLLDLPVEKRLENRYQRIRQFGRYES